MGNTKPEDKTEEGLEEATPPGHAGGPTLRLGGAAALVTPLARPVAYKKPPMQKP